MTTRKGAGTASTRIAGCFMMLFGLPFFGAGVFVLIESVRGLLGLKPVEGGLPAMFFMLILSLVLAGIGATILYIGVKGVRGQWIHMKNRPRGQLQEGNWQKNKYFPKVKRRKFGPRRGIALKAQRTALAGFVGLLLVTIFWNGLSSGGLIAVLSERGSGAAKWAPVIFLSLFVLIGLALIAATVYQFFRVVLVGTPTVEVDIEPLQPGTRSRLRVYQPGDFDITSASVHMVFREQVTYRQGTDTVTAEKEVHVQELTRCSTCRASRSKPILETEFQIPEWAMHSFNAPNNKLQWGIRVIMDIPNRPDVKDLYFFRVTPSF